VSLSWCPIWAANILLWAKRSMSSGLLDEGAGPASRARMALAQRTVRA
jgi:hypothetical protein